MDTTRFAGRNIVVTGAASGIGRSSALRLAAEGLAVAHADPTVLVADHDQSSERKVATALHHLGDAVDEDDAVYEIAD